MYASHYTFELYQELSVEASWRKAFKIIGEINEDVDSIKFPNWNFGMIVKILITRRNYENLGNCFSSISEGRYPEFGFWIQGKYKRNYETEGRLRNS